MIDNVRNSPAICPCFLQPWFNGMQIEKVSETNPAYHYDKSKDIVNWFDQDPIDPAFYSIADSIAVLADNAKACQVVAKLLAKAAGQDEGTAQLDPEAVKLMGRLTLPNLCKYTGDAISKADINQANRVLQTIKKGES